MVIRSTIWFHLLYIVEWVLTGDITFQLLKAMAIGFFSTMNKLR